MRYSSYYNKYIEKAAVLLCLSQADTRAYLRDEEFYANLISNGVITSCTNIIIGINQIDLLFKTKDNPNGIDLSTIDPLNPLIQSKIDDCFGAIYKNIFRHHNLSREDVCAFSAYQKWNLNSLMSLIISKTK